MVHCFKQCARKKSGSRLATVKHHTIACFTHDRQTQSLFGTKPSVPSQFTTHILVCASYVTLTGVGASVGERVGAGVGTWVGAFQQDHSSVSTLIHMSVSDMGSWNMMQYQTKQLKGQHKRQTCMICTTIVCAYTS
jgi:hypothetical protein